MSMPKQKPGQSKLTDREFNLLEDGRMSMPKQKPGKSFQSYATPWEFIRAVEGRFGPIVCDLAAAPSNAKAKRFYDPRRRSGRIGSL